VLGRFDVVLLERDFGSIHYIAGSASGAEEICTMAGGVHVLWPIATYVDEQG
jgi:ABC-type hemin transport system substrate-binding protein